MTINNLIFDHVKRNDIAATSFWPFEGEDANFESLQVGSPAGDGGPWTLYMDHANGAMYLWPTDKRVPSRLNPNVVARGEKEELIRAFSSYCTNEAGRVINHPYKYQDNAHRFNWPTGTLAGVGIAIKVIGAALAGDRGKGWDIGKACENKVERAMDPEYWAARDAMEAEWAKEREAESGNTDESVGV